MAFGNRQNGGITVVLVSEIVQLYTGNSLLVCINTHLKSMLFLARCPRSSLALTRAVQRPVQGNPGRRKLAGASANCGILRRKSALSLSVSQSGLAGVEGGPGSG